MFLASFPLQFIVPARRNGEAIAFGSCSIFVRFRPDDPRGSAPIRFRPDPALNGESQQQQGPWSIAELQIDGDEYLRLDFDGLWLTDSCNPQEKRAALRRALLGQVPIELMFLRGPLPEPDASNVLADPVRERERQCSDLTEVGVVVLRPATTFLP